MSKPFKILRDKMSDESKFMSEELFNKLIESANQALEHAKQINKETKRDNKEIENKTNEN